MSTPTATDETPAFYPPGWDRERLMTATQENILALPPEQLDALRTGLQTHLGPQGFSSFLAEMRAREEARRGAASSGAPRDRPNFLRVLERRYPGQEEWGFVVFRTTAYGDNGDEGEGQWAAFRRRWDEIVDAQLDYYDGVLGVAEAKQRLRFQWVEDRALGGAGAEEVASRYRELDVSAGLKQSLCLSVTSAALASVLNSPLPSSAPRGERREIPYVVAVDMYAGVVPGEEEGEDAAGHDFSGYFNVAVESVLEELFAVIGDQSRTPYELGGHVHGADVWCSPGRFGVHRADGGDARR